MRLPPGTIEIKFRLSGDDARQFRLMARDAKQPDARLAKSIILELLADDRAAHSFPSLMTDDATRVRSPGIESEKPIRNGTPA